MRNFIMHINKVPAIIMKCKILNEKNGTIYSFGITSLKEKINVLHGHLFYDKEIEVEKVNDKFYIPKKLNYNEQEILAKYQDADNLIEFSLLNEDFYVSKPGKRIYNIDDRWFFIPKIITKVVEYLYENSLISNSKLKLTRQHTIHSSRAPIININYDKMFERVVSEKKAVNAYFYSEEEKDYERGIYADFYVLGSQNNNEIQFELWQIIGNGEELLYSHFIKNIESQSFKHFDLATHIKSEEAKIEDLLFSKMKPLIDKKVKWFRNDNNFTEKQIFDITKLFFPLDDLFNEFLEKNCD